MRTVPRKKWPQIFFYADHVPKWTERAEVLGLDPDLLATMQAAVDEARQAYDAQQAARRSALGATDRLNQALEVMNQHGSGLLKQIRAQSATLGPEAYTLGLISPPEKASPIGQPGTPDKFTVELTQLGTLVLRWKCRHPRGARGTTYHISRQLDGTGAFEFLGIAGRKRFEDATLPPGVREATYRIQAMRSTAVGLTATHTVNFGFAAPGLPVPGNLQLAA